MDKALEQRVAELEKEVGELECRFSKQPWKYVDNVLIQISDSLMTTRTLSKIGLTLSIISLLCMATYFILNTIHILGK